MQIPLRVTFHGTDPSPAVEARVREEADALARLHDRIIGCAVTVDAPPRHRNKGGTWNVRVVMSLPTGDVAANHNGGANHAHEDVYVAIRDAFAATRRQLQDQVHRARGDVKRHGPPPT